MRRLLLITCAFATVASTVALLGFGPAAAPQAPGRDTAAPEHPGHHARRRRLLERRRLQPRHDGADAQHRPHRARGHALHRPLRAADLHAGPRRLHHRPAADPHRPDDGRPAGLAGRARRARPDARRSAEAARLPHRASSARTTSATATSTCRRCTASTSSSATCTTSTPRRSPSCRSGRKRSRLQPALPPARRARRAWPRDVDDPTVDPRFGRVGKQRITRHRAR